MTPLMMAIIAFCATVLPYLGDGPFWSDAIIMYNSWCKKNWWLNSIYLHNFLNRENMVHINAPLVVFGNKLFFSA